MTQPPALPGAQPPKLPREKRSPQRKPRSYATVSARIPTEQKRILDDLSLTTGIGVDDLVRFALLRMLMDGANALLATKQARAGAASLIDLLGKLPEADENEQREISNAPD